MVFWSSNWWHAYYAGKHVLITGASEGVGLELAKMLSSTGARVSLLARTPSKLRAAEAACLERLGPEASSDPGRWVAVAPADVTDERAVYAAVADAEAAIGRPADVLLCCAGAAECGALPLCSREGAVLVGGAARHWQQGPGEEGKILGREREKESAAALSPFTSSTRRRLINPPATTPPPPHPPQQRLLPHLRHSGAPAHDGP